LLILQSVAHLYGGRLVGSLALIESVKEVQKQVFYGLVADSREVDNPVGEARDEVLMGQVAQELGFAYARGAVKLRRSGSAECHGCGGDLRFTV
jgi:hypothetical protein